MKVVIKTWGPRNFDQLIVADFTDRVFQNMS